VNIDCLLLLLLLTDFSKAPWALQQNTAEKDYVEPSKVAEKNTDKCVSSDAVMFVVGCLVCGPHSDQS